MTQANLQQANGNVRMVPVDIAVVPVTSGGATKTVTFANAKTIQHVTAVSIATSAGVRRLPSGAVTIGSGANANVVTVADGGFANGDTIFCQVAHYNV